MTIAEYIERDKVIWITAETGALETQARVKELPAADVQPVVHGIWMEDHTEFVCSVCGQRVDGEIVFMIKPNALPGFCPNPMCGAKMI